MLYGADGIKIASAIRAILGDRSPRTMRALDALHSRSSVPKLTDPMPDQTALENIFKAAFRAADHAVLRPWRFLIIKGDARQRLGELFAAAATADQDDVAEEKLQRLREKPFRAPLIMVTVASAKEHHKVPEFEQDLSAAAATQNMLTAAHAQGFGAMWRTGSMAYHPLVKKGLGLEDHEKIIGFIYMGTIEGPTKNLSDPTLEEFFKEW